MATHTSVGTATALHSEQAARSAVQQAMARLPLKPDWGIVFAAHRHDLGRVLAAARELVPGAAIIGCSSAGELGERGLSHNSICVMLVSSDDMSCSQRLATETSKDYKKAAEVLCQDLEGDARAAAQQNRLERASIVLGDALQGPFEKLVTEVRRITKPHHKIVGGAAGDDATFSHTPLGVPGNVGTDRAAALHLFSRAPIGLGIGHGFEPLTDKKMVTKSSGALIAKVDGRPAYQVFVDYARQRGMPPPGASEQPIEFLKRIGGSLFGVFFFDDVCRVRGAHTVTPEGGVYVSGEIPEGSQICVIGADADAQIGAAKAAAEEARGNLKGRAAAGVLVFSCITRKFVLGDQYNREISAIRSVFPDAPLCGFLSYGEIARFNGRLDGYHNATCVVAALPSRFD